MRTRERHQSAFFSKDNRTVILTRQDFLPDHTADGDLLFTFSSNILDFGRSLSSYLKFGSRHEDSSRFYRWKGRLVTRKSRSTRFKNSFFYQSLNCSKSSNIFLIFSRSSLKRLKRVLANILLQFTKLNSTRSPQSHQYLNGFFLTIFIVAVSFLNANNISLICNPEI